MTTERSRKKIVLEHCRRMNAGDVDGLLELYTPDVTFADPVGWPQQTGHAALRAHLESAVAAHVRETPGEPVAGQDGKSVLLPVTSVMDYWPRGPVYVERGWIPAPEQPERPEQPDPGGLRCMYVLALRVGEAGLVEDMRAFWGRGDIEITG